MAHGLDKLLVIYRRPGKSLSSNKVNAVKRIWGAVSEGGRFECRSVGVVSGRMGGESQLEESGEG